MKFHRVLATAAALLIVSGCSCGGCASTIDSGGGKGRDAGVGVGSDGGDGAGGGAGAGSGGGTGGEDAGDGTSSTTVGPGSFSLDGGSSSGDGVKISDAGYIVLNTNDVQLHFMWIANVSAGTVSKYDTRTGKEVGRYVAAITVNGAGASSGLTGDPSYGHAPSRTAIDLLGDVWVANRAPGKQGSVTKIANSTNDCKDRNGNNVIDTSKDLNADGDISANEMITPTDWSVASQYDECILFTQALGSPNGSVGARALGISATIEGGAGNVWVGMYADKRFYKLRSTDGIPQAVDSNGNMFVTLAWGPYGAAIDSKQRLWAVVPGAAHLALIDTVTGTLISDNLVPPSGHISMGSYGIAIDGKDRVWLPGWTAGAKASRYDHGPGLGATVGTWTGFQFSAAVSQTGTGLGRGRGIAADDQGFIWMSADTNSGGANAAQLIGFDQETGAIKRFQTPTGPVDFIDGTDANSGSSIGVALDGDGNPWVNNYSGNAMRVHRTTGALLKTAQQAGALYTYSDNSNWKKLNPMACCFEHDTDAQGSTTTKMWEWR